MRPAGSENPGSGGRAGSESHRYPGRRVRVLVLNSRTVESDTERERGFTDGFKSVLPDALFLDR